MTMHRNLPPTTKNRCHILSDNGGTGMNLADTGSNPNGVPSYSPRLPESARATLGLRPIINPTLKGLHNTIPVHAP